MQIVETVKPAPEMTYLKLNSIYKSNQEYFTLKRNISVTHFVFDKYGWKSKRCERIFVNSISKVASELW